MHGAKRVNIVIILEISTLTSWLRYFVECKTASKIGDKIGGGDK